MIGKQSQPDNSEDNQSRMKLITNKRKFLEEKSAQVNLFVMSFDYYCTFLSFCVLNLLFRVYCTVLFHLRVFAIKYMNTIYIHRNTKYIFFILNRGIMEKKIFADRGGDQKLLR